MITRIFDVDPLFEGIEEWLLVVALMATVFAAICMYFLPFPSEALMRDIANIGIVLVLAFIVEAAWLTPHVVDGTKSSKYELGMLLGIGIAGLIGVVAAVLVAAHLAAGHGNLLDDFGLGWAVASILGLGTMVILHPLLVHIWEGPRAGKS